MQYSQESHTRLQKIQILKNNGIIVYANRFTDKSTISELLASDNLQPSERLLESGAEATYRISGRIILFRNHGKLSFAKIIDHTGSIQLAFSKGLLSFINKNQEINQIQIEDQILDPYQLINKFVDVGDYIGVDGELFLTNHGEKTLFVKSFTILSKAIRPLPDKFHGLNDMEAIYKQRYLDLIADEDSYQRFVFRSEFIKLLRDFYHSEGFVEITTPILWNSASGAAAKPFVTYHNDFKQDMFLRIAPEIALKKATVGRFEKVFEFATNFRNEGTDPSHMQEFSVVEHYAVGWNYEDNMAFTERMFDFVFEKMHLSKQIKVKDKEWVERIVDFTTPWKRIDYIKGVEEACGIDVSTYQEGDEPKLLAELKKRNIAFENMEVMGLTTLIDYLYKKVLRPSIIGPAFVYNYPKIMQPLARQSDEDPNIVEQFQLVVNGWELNKAYSELVDPQIQVENFLAQKQALQRGDEEATDGDYEFVLSMEYGMPPQSGFGMGIERLLTILLEQDNLRDVYLFPIVKSSHIESSDFENFYFMPQLGDKKAINLINEGDFCKISFNVEEELLMQYYQNHLDATDYELANGQLSVKKTAMIKGKPIEKFTKELNKKLEKVQFGGKHFTQKIDFDQMQSQLNAFAQHLQEKKIEIKSLLKPYLSSQVFESELAQTIALLQNIETSKNYFTHKLEQTVSFIEDEASLYSLARFVLIPAMMTNRLLLRKPASKSDFFADLVQLLELDRYFPSIELIDQSENDFIHSTSQTIKENGVEIPQTDAVIFAGKAHKATEIRKHYAQKTLFITAGKGHNPLLVGNNADLDAATDAALHLQLYHQGQSTRAANTILVQESVYADFIQKLVKKIWHFISENPQELGNITLRSATQLHNVSQLFLKNASNLNQQLANAGQIDFVNAKISPSIIEKPLNEGANYADLDAPIFFVQKYQDASELASYFEDPRYRAQAMYLTVYGEENYLEELIWKNIAGAGILHSKETLLHNKHLGDAESFSPDQPFGGVASEASAVSYQGKVHYQAILPQREIHDFLIKNDITSILA